MSSKVKQFTDIEQQVVVILMELLKSLYSTRKIGPDEISSLFFRSYSPSIEVERERVWRIIKTLQSANKQISPSMIFSHLICYVVNKVVFHLDSPFQEDLLEHLARERTGEIIQYSSDRDVDVPIVFLEIDESEIKVGKVSFYPILNNDREGEWWENITQNYPGKPFADVISYGRVNVFGDTHVALSNAENILRKTLIILRGIALPFDSENVFQFGLLNDSYVWSNLPFRQHQPIESVRFESASGVVTRIGSPQRSNRLYSDLLNKVDTTTLEAVNDILCLDNEVVLTEMQGKLISGLVWLGEATKPDILPARYLKLSTALEFLVGGESNNELLTTRGITATLAERSAFLLGNDREHRSSIDQKVRKYYGLRSKIIHGHASSIDSKVFVAFGDLVRQIAFALCREFSSFITFDEFQVWITKLRYS